MEHRAVYKVDDGPENPKNDDYQWRTDLEDGSGGVESGFTRLGVSVVEGSSTSTSDSVSALVATASAPNGDQSTGGPPATFSFGVTNNGPDVATQVVAFIAIPDNQVFVDSSQPANYSPSIGIWDVGDLAVGATATLSVDFDLVGSIGNVVSSGVAFDAKNVIDNISAARAEASINIV